MGMFDRVWVECPKCGKGVEFQSKAGDCVLADYTLDNVPIIVGLDLIHEKEKCENCGAIVIVEVDTVQHINFKSNTC